MEMKSIKDIVESKNSLNELNAILKKCGWYEAEHYNGKIICAGEDTVITFSFDEDNKPYISGVQCKFHTADAAHRRDLKGLLDLFDELQKN